MLLQKCFYKGVLSSEIFMEITLNSNTLKYKTLGTLKTMNPCVTKFKGVDSWTHVSQFKESS